MFKNFINEKSYNLYKKIKGKINIILFVVLILLLIWIVVSFLIQGRNFENTNETESKSSYQPQETVIDGDDIDEEEYKEEESIINTFVEYCNNGQVAEAYNMLSSDCKESLYPAQADFEQNYYNEIFSSKKICNLQSWINGENYTTYRVRFIDDIMSTGSYEDSHKYEDYITIIQNNDGSKYLGISNYIIKQDIADVSKETDELYIQVKSVETYIDYMDYTFSVKNKSNKVILLDTLEDISDTMYIMTNSDKRITCNPNGLNRLKLRIEPNTTETIKIRYNQVAGNDDTNKEITFSNIIKDYETYLQDRENYSDILTLTIEL